MSLNLPNNSKEINQRSRTDVQRELPTSNVSLPNSWLGAIIKSCSNRIFDFYLQLKEAIIQALPDTAENTYLERWASIWGITRIPATPASGFIIATGTDTTDIPFGTTYASSDGIVYESTASVVITATVLNVTSITRAGSLATVTTDVDHNLASNVSVIIAGANETEYNGTVEITVTGPDTFTYTVTGSPSSPATGTITASHTSIPVPVIATVPDPYDPDIFGSATNQVLDAILTLQSPIAGADNDAWVNYDELAGGTDQESDDSVRTRLLERIQNPVANFNVSAIETKAKEVAGVTRVFVQEVTPAVGQVTIYFMRDNDIDPIPTAGEVTTVKNKILEIKPANTSDANVIVSAPTGVTTNFIFSALTPNTSTMQTAVQASLRQFYDEIPEIGIDITSDAYRSAIYNTIDLETGDKVQSFTLSSPAGDITIASGEIGVLGTVTFP